MTLRFMTRAEIADFLGVSLSTVKQLRNFPQPDVMIGRTQGWARETIEAWAAVRRPIRHAEPETQKRPPAGSV